MTRQQPLCALILSSNLAQASPLVEEARRLGCRPELEQMQTPESLESALTRPAWNVLVCLWPDRVSAMAAAPVLAQFNFPFRLSSVESNGGARIVLSVLRTDESHAGQQDEHRLASFEEALLRPLRKGSSDSGIPNAVAAGMAHDLNTLVTLISAVGELLLEAVPRNSPAREHAEKIRHFTARAKALALQLLDLSRSRALGHNAVELNSELHGLESVLQRLLGDRIELKIQFRPRATRVPIGPADLERILTNLAANARDAMPRGGRLVIAVGAVTLPDGAYAALTLKDNGEGMDALTQSRIFEPFFTTREHGSGLGLSVVQSLVEQSGGSIKLSSHLGVGAEFQILFPLLPGAAESQAKA